MQQVGWKLLCAAKKIEMTNNNTLAALNSCHFHLYNPNLNMHHQRKQIYLLRTLAIFSATPRFLRQRNKHDVALLRPHRLIPHPTLLVGQVAEPRLLRHSAWAEIKADSTALARRLMSVRRLWSRA